MIGGTAVQTRAYPTVCHIGQYFLEDGFTTHFIDGAHRDADGQLTVATPSQQADYIRNNVPPNTDQRQVYITHCLGMAAAVELMAEDDGNSMLYALSPPLPTPLATTTTEHFLRNIAHQDGHDCVPGFSWADKPFEPTKDAPRVDVQLPRKAYYAELARHENAFIEDLTKLHEEDRVRLVVAKRDWNHGSVELGRHFTHLALDATHSLLDTETSAPRSSDLPIHKTIIDFIVRAA